MKIGSSILKICQPKILNLPISNLSNPKWICSHYHNFSLSLLEKPLKHQNHLNQVLSQAIASGLFTDPFISSKLLNSLPYSHDLTLSHTLFSQIKNPNIFAYNVMLKSFSHSQSPLLVITLYNQMQLCNDILPDNYTFPFVLKACGRLLVLHKGLEVHCLSVKLGFECEVFVQNALISMYSMCGVVEIARRVFYMIPVFVRDVVSWNSMVSGYLQSDCNLDALKVFVEMLGDPFVILDDVSLVSVFSGCGKMGFLDLGSNIHGLIVKNGFDLNVFSGSSLIDMYAKCGCMDDARKVFDRILDRNVVCWTSMIVGYAQLHMFKEAIELFREMQLGGIVADATLVACVLSASGHLGALDQGRWVHRYCEKNGIDMNLSVRNALIDLYSKCGDIEKSLEVFNELSKKDVISWTAMISGLAMNGKFDESLSLFVQMEKFSDVRPNEVTFLGVLSACSHGGFIDKGFHYLRSMTQIYNLTPRIAHYGCIVDLLGRANLLEEAESFIRAMPIQPDVAMWRSLLFACTSHGNVKLAELAASKIEELEPRSCGERVLLSNMYASVSRWSDVKRVRKSMADGKIQKHPGCSFIELNGFVHEFFVADNSHSQLEDIYETLIGIDKVLR
ncbi:PPR domain-containing protein/PPR_2 domain-containing protein/PPR_3 domain-containing protein [Cephalotus follicularis]|uniref:PPR domain-containing protein/PPR_2 domain-containing protein/PPR_3 domain-containing protein n=1 Tax=Cephalotus follicularis TaxID=3775 RepID=A0A1Q3CRU3_CEPFO|nr:PPR domain-containing protein/PPR_2 domain-containing protein/PPR_3 domain-containing protein [Cephalotus follicularis]